MSASVRAFAPGGYGTAGNLTFSTAAVAGDVVVVGYVNSAFGTVGPPSGLPTGMGATWTLVHDDGKASFWVGRGVTAGQTTLSVSGVGRVGVSHRYMAWLVSGVVNPQTVVAAFARSSAGPVQNAQTGQFVAAVATGGNALVWSPAQPASPPYHPTQATWVGYDMTTTGTSEHAAACPTSTEPVPHQIVTNSDVDDRQNIAQLVLGEPAGPGSARLAAAQVQILEQQPATSARAGALQVEALVDVPPAQAQVARLGVQVLMPATQTLAVVDAVQVQVMVASPWVVSASDGETPVQVLHSDGVWRPIYLV